jgi:hypothetical protein
LNIWFETAYLDSVRSVGEWGDEDEKLCAFLRRNCRRFSRVLGAVKKLFELNSCAASNMPYCVAEAVN